MRVCACVWARWRVCDHGMAAGSWHFDFSDPEGPQLGTVAMHPSNPVQLAEDPVVVVSTSGEMGISLSNNVNAEILLMVDRADRHFVPNAFFAFAEGDGSVTIRWQEQVEEDQAVLGRVVFVTVPFLPAMKKKASGFLEEEDDFNY